MIVSSIRHVTKVDLISFHFFDSDVASGWSPAWLAYHYLSSVVSQLGRYYDEKNQQLYAWLRGSRWVNELYEEVKETESERK